MYLTEKKKISPPHFTDETKPELIKMHDDNGEALEKFGKNEKGVRDILSCYGPGGSSFGSCVLLLAGVAVHLCLLAGEL